MKGYRGRAKLPVFKFYKGYPLVKIFVDNGTDTSKSAIYLDLHLVRGVVYTPPIKVLLTKLNANLPISDNEIILAKLAIELGDLGEE
jgi:hypothetical protein